MTAPINPAVPDELRVAIHEAIHQSIQVTRIGRATDSKPNDQIWFTTQMQDLFVLLTDETERRLLALFTQYGRQERLDELERWFTIRKNGGEVRLGRPDRVVLLPLTGSDVEGLKLRVAELKANKQEGSE